MSAKFQKIGNRSLIGLGVVVAVGLGIELGVWAVFGLFGLVAAIGLYEIRQLFAGSGRGVKAWLVYGAGGALYAGGGLMLAGVPTVWAAGVAAAAGLLGLGLGCVQEGRNRKQTQGITAAGCWWSLWAAVYVALPLALLVWLRRADLLWPLFIIIWASDVFAYVVGSSFREEKRHKLAPRISPAKSWEGACGGFCAAIAAGVVWAVCNGLPVTLFAAFAAVVAVVGVLGDLLESHYKRQAGIKDSGTLLGGHGGILDRFDSILLAAPAAVLLQIICL
ncbi:MAG: phosphatidate cytidylyltransferase [Bacteroidales bacterium]|nr:phosphatidate cytidylyltransferase [Bacteroidales bacterium]